MAIEITSLVLIFLVSFTPFIVIGAARWSTLLYKRNVAKGKTQHDPSQLPILVRLNKFILKKVSISLGVYISSELVFFGIPIVATALIWPEDLISLAEFIAIPTILLTAYILLHVACESPDPTGGLGNL